VNEKERNEWTKQLMEKIKVVCHDYNDLKVSKVIPISLR
jgi:hypothetical protein